MSSKWGCRLVLMDNNAVIYDGIFKNDEKVAVLDLPTGKKMIIEVGRICIEHHKIIFGNNAPYTIISMDYARMEPVTEKDQ